MNLINSIINQLDVSGFQVPAGMTEQEMMDLMMKLYKSVQNYFIYYMFNADYNELLKKKKKRKKILKNYYY